MNYEPIGTKDIQQILTMFKTLKKEQLCIYLSKIKGIEDIEKCEKIINKIVKITNISCSKDDLLSFDSNPVMDTNSINIFWVILHMMEDREPFIDIARYPNDYIFIVNNTLYEIMNYNKGGNMKLNFMNHKLREETDGSVPLLILLNEKINVIPSELLPKFDYKIVELKVDALNKTKPIIEIKDGIKG